MIDIVERLRAFGPDWTIRHVGHVIPYELCVEAVAEIERLRLALDMTEGEVKNGQQEIDRLNTEIERLRWEKEMGECLR